MSRQPFLIVAVLFAVLAAVAARDSDYCYKDDQNKYFMFASKTAYDLSRKHHQGQENIPHCTPLQVWWLNRHGTRYPGKKSIVAMERLWDLKESIIHNHAEGTGSLCNEDLEGLREWRLRVNTSMENILTQAGEQELKLTGARLRDRFPEALKQPYSASKYQFRHTPSQRTERSARMFAEGMFPNGDAVAIPPAEADDKLLQPYASCATWQDGDKNDPPEFRKLLDSAEAMQMVKDVSMRLGFLGSLKFEDVNVMYDMCRFEKAWNVEEISPWCAAFTKEQIEFMEYAEDLRYYYKSGYGDDNAVKLGCPLAKDLWERFKLLADGTPDQPVGVFYFAHSSTLHMLQARLGMFRDAEPLRADNRKDHSERLWRVSQMGSFGATLGAIFYSCRLEDERNSTKVLFLSSEGDVDVDGCHLGLCSWEKFRDLLEPLAEQCSLSWCEPDNGGASSLVLGQGAAAIMWSATTAAAARSLANCG